MINFKKGFKRLWLALSIFWVVAFLFLSDFTEPLNTLWSLGFQERSYNIEKEYNRLNCFVILGKKKSSEQEIRSILNVIDDGKNIRVEIPINKIEKPNPYSNEESNKWVTSFPIETPIADIWEAAIKLYTYEKEGLNQDELIKRTVDFEDCKNITELKYAFSFSNLELTNEVNRRINNSREALLKVLLWLIMPILISYILGLIFVWVIKGFRN